MMKKPNIREILFGLCRRHVNADTNTGISVFVDGEIVEEVKVSESYRRIRKYFNTTKVEGECVE